MPAYLTHAAVLIKMTEWLELVRAKVDERRNLLKADGRGLSSVDERFYTLAGQALTFLREEPMVGGDVALPTTRIANGVGDALSKYAFVGTLGPDLPAAGYILAMNQGWARETFHNGTPRRALVNAKSTTFVLKLLELAERDQRNGRLTLAQRRRFMSYALGHLVHVAADVVLHPAVHQLTWNAKRGALAPLEQQLFEVAVDAQLAKAFYQRKDLYDDIQSWEDYYLDKGDFKDQLTLLMSHLSKAFEGTYGSITPNGVVCGIKDPSKCLAPKVDAAFLMDAYRNTTNWAIDEGYDHGPLSMDIVWTLAIAGGMIGTFTGLAGRTEKLSPWTKIADQADVDAISAQLSERWQNDGTKNVELWRDVVDKALTIPSIVLLPFELLFQGGLPMRLLTFWQAPDGIFGQGTASFTDKPLIREITSILFPVKTIAFLVLSEIVPKLTEDQTWKWIWFVVDLAKDVLEHLFLTNESRASNFEADRMADTTYWPKKILAASYFVGSALMLFWKSERHASDGSRAKGLEKEDFLFPIFIWLLTSGIFVWSGMWRDYLLEKTARSRWPSRDTKSVEDLLPFTSSNGKKKLTSDKARTFKVRLFDDSEASFHGAIDVGSDPVPFFPEGPATMQDSAETIARSDIEARRAKLKEWPDKDYALPDLLDHAARFAGLLAMSAVAYNEAEAPVRQHLTSVFKDWNLDFATVSQWRDLLLEANDESMGWLEAAARWTKDLELVKKESEPAVTNRLQGALGVSEIAGGIEADFLHTTPSSIDVPSARSMRTTRPGALLLANLDLETIPAVATPLPSRVGLVDARVDDKVSAAGNDAAELTRVRIRNPGSAGAPHDLVLQLKADDAKRVRVFEVTTGTPDTWPLRLGASASGAVTEYQIPAPPPETVELAIEALTLTGDPGMARATGPGPVGPMPFPPGGGAAGAPVVPERRPNEIWLEVLHKDKGTIVPGIRDTAVFTVAPWILLPNTRPVERIWILYIPDTLTRFTIKVGGGTFSDDRVNGNHPTVADLHDALKTDAVLGPKLKVKTHAASSGELDEFTPHQPVELASGDDAGPFYIIDGARIAEDDTQDLGGGASIRKVMADQWVQDEFELGYTAAPHATMHVALHNPRRGLARELGKFVDTELPGENLGLFSPFPTMSDSVDFGGNLECSPPVASRTGDLADGNAGPFVPAAEPASHGKIILGEGAPYLFDVAESFAAELAAGTVTPGLIAEFKKNKTFLDASATVLPLTASTWRITVPGRGMAYELRRSPGKVAAHFWRGVMPDYRKFLEQQRVQPIVTIDTSWLQVGHVDEIMSIVPDADPARFRLVVASSQLATNIFKEAKALSSATNKLTKLFRRRRWFKLSFTRPEERPKIAEGFNAAQTVEKALTRGQAFNEKLQTERLIPIRDRLREALDVPAAEVIELPVYFDALLMPLWSHLGGVHWQPKTSALAEKFTEMRTVAYTPGLTNLVVVNDHLMIPKPFGPRMSVANAVTVLTNAGMKGVDAGDLNPLLEHDSWERRGTALGDIAASYGVSAAAIKAANAGKFTAGDTVRRNWDRIHIPEPNVDLFEAATVVAFKPITSRIKLHFIDTWDWYHRMDGELHCGTNVKRTPYEADAAFAANAWWNSPAVK